MLTRAPVRALRAFTLTELLVVIAVLMLLLSILMPTLARARKTTRMVREMAHAQQMTQIYLAYTNDAQDMVVNGLPSWDVIRSNCPYPRYAIKAPDPFNKGTFIDGGTAKVWTFYLHGWANTPLHALQIDKDTYDTFMSRPRPSASGSYGWTDYNQDSAVTAFAFHPTLGLNGTMVGGSYRHEGLRGPAGLSNGSLGLFYVRKTSDVRDTSRLSVFSSSRGCDVGSPNNYTFWSFGGAHPDSGREMPGYMLVTPPSGPSGCNGWRTTYPGADNRRYDPRMVPSTWGNVAFRHFDQAVVSSMDGHVQMRNLDEMRDMRLWSNKATSANWTFYANAP